MAANTTYVASYFAPHGEYAADQYYFGGGAADAVPLHALANGVDGENGLFSYSSSSTFPTGSFRSTNYWVDAVFITTSGVTPSAYTYDPAGNRLSGNGTTSSYDKADQITRDGSRVDTVNANGNLTARGSGSFSYDQANRLMSATVTGITSTFVYDGDGKRTSATFGTNPATSYVYDAAGGLPVVLIDGARKYVWGANGLAYEADTLIPGTVQSVPLMDGLGSVRALTNSSGALVQTYRTDPFGVPTAAGSQGSSTQPLTFTGEQSDATGLTYLRGRMYDPQTGRFVQRDAAGGDNRYAYAANNPASRTDPSGADSFDPGFGSDDNRLKCGDPFKDPLHLSCPDLTLVTPEGALVRLDPIVRTALDLMAARGGGEVEVEAASGSGRSITRPGRGRFDSPDPLSYDKALVEARVQAGDLGSSTQKMYDPRTGTLIGEQSSDTLRGWRIDRDHVNWWDWTGGKKPSGGRYGHAWFPESQSGPHSEGIGYAPWVQEP